MELTKEIAIKVKETVECGLSTGLGKQIPGEMCIEAAVCYAYGLPHGDNPPCVGKEIRNFKISLNDSKWSSNKTRAEGMIKLSIAQLNSNVLDQLEFTRRLRIKLINNIISKIANKHFPEIEKELKEVDNLDDAWNLCQNLDRKLSSCGLVFVASGYCYDTFHGDVGFYSSEIAKLIECTTDDVLKQASDACLGALIEMKSPGCEYLYLLDN